MSKQYKERRLYFAGKCSNCGNGFQSFKRSRIKHGLCRKCRKNAPNPNQVSLFTQEDQKTIDAGGTVVREGMIAGEHHKVEMTKGRLTESINGVPTLIVGELPE